MAVINVCTVSHCLFSPQYTYEAEEPQKTVSLEVVWNGDNVVDDNYGITGNFKRVVDFFSFRGK
jgi:hypothetical protein